MASKSNSTARRKTAKRDKRKQKSPEMVKKLIALGVPSALADDWPLTPHLAGKRWCKKLKVEATGKHKVFYFGSLDNWQAAHDKYKAEVDDLIAGRTPESRDADGMRLLDLVNKFLHVKRALVEAIEPTLTLRSWYDLHQTCQRIVDVLGKDRIVESLNPADFEKLLADYGKTWKAVRVGNEVNRARGIFKYAFESDLVKSPVHFGPSFKRPTRKTLRKLKAKQRAEHGPRMFTREELRTILDAAPQPLKAMVMLGINGGFHNMDVATLRFAVMDLDRGWIDFARGKTGVDRRTPLWPETIESIKAWLAVRPEPKSPEDAQLVFLTKTRRPWHRLGRFENDDKGRAIAIGFSNPVSQAFRVLLDNLGINGRNFLALRHGFRTIARGAKDREAIDSLMGHIDASQAAEYIEDGLPDERLLAVTEYVRNWLFGEQVEPKGEKTKPQLRVVG
jgi:integrase